MPPIKPTSLITTSGRVSKTRVQNRNLLSEASPRKSLLFSEEQIERACVKCQLKFELDPLKSKWHACEKSSCQNWICSKCNKKNPTEEFFCSVNCSK